MIVMLQLNEFSKALLSVRISRWSPNMKAFFAVDRYRRFVVSIFVMKRRAKFNEILQAFRGSGNCSFWPHLFPTSLFPFLFFSIHSNNWVIYWINKWHRSNLVFSSGKDRLWSFDRSIFPERNKIVPVFKFLKCSFPCSLGLLSFFLFLFNRLIDKSPDFWMNATRLHRWLASLHSTSTDYWTVQHSILYSRAIYRSTTVAVVPYYSL